MLIDPFTVVAQVVNFLVLVWLLKRFLYHPILSAIDAREKRIAGELADAEAKQADALKERDAYREKNQSIDRERDALMRQARADAETERQRLLEEARQAAADLEARRRESLEQEARTLNAAVGQRAQREVLGIAHKALTDLAGASLEGRMCEVFLDRLRATDAATRAVFTSSTAGGAGEALVRSAFDLSAEQRAAIERAIADVFLPQGTVRFERREDLVSGIELAAGGHKIAWSIGDYLASLQRGIDEVLRGASGADPGRSLGPAATGSPVSAVIPSRDDDAGADRHGT